MAKWFLIVIYAAFISLGLPDSLLGTAWPSMWQQLGAPFNAAGMISMTIAVGTIISSLSSGYVVKRLGTGFVTFISCVMTAGALVGFAYAPSLIWLFLAALPLGLGAGSVDAALNQYVAEHYEAHHMNWLHASWGIGATAGPILMALGMTTLGSWRSGYLVVSSIQWLLVAALFFTLPLWAKVARRHSEKSEYSETNENLNENVIKIPGVFQTLMGFFFYCGVEMTVGLWGASYLVMVKDMAPAQAAGWVAIYYGGITLGRFLTGFMTMKFSNGQLIRGGQVIAMFGALLLFLPLSSWMLGMGLLMIGLGFAPIFPGLTHETPKRFGSQASGKVIGFQMASAYVGILTLPPLFGWLSRWISLSAFPVIVLLEILFMTWALEWVNKLIGKRV